MNEGEGGVNEGEEGVNEEEGGANEGEGGVNEGEGGVNEGEDIFERGMWWDVEEVGVRGIEYVLSFAQSS